ncbi:MAG: MFS transporter, partial [Longicatena sp.]
IKNITKTKEDVKVSEYEDDESHKSIFTVLKERKTILIFLVFSALSGLVYSQFNFLMPLNLEYLYGAKGAIYFGLITSVNAIVVIVGTPLLTSLFPKIKDVSKIIIGEILI